MQAVAKVPFPDESATVPVPGEDFAERYLLRQAVARAGAHVLVLDPVMDAVL